MDVRLPEPWPRVSPGHNPPHCWNVAGTIELPTPRVVASDLFSALARRRSAMRFGPLRSAELGELLWHVMRVDAMAPSPYGFQQERRPTPSAGAIHPIHVLVAEPGTEAAALYRPRLHQLDVLADSAGHCDKLRSLARTFYDVPDATVMAFVAEPGLTAAKYGNPASLVWRDAGVLQGTMALAAEGLGLPFRLLGATGDAIVAPLAKQGVLVGVGLALVGT